MSDLTTNQTVAVEGDAQFGDYVSLLKPRVMSLVVFTALVGLIVAPGAVDPMIGFASILFIALGAGASGSLNMWYDADIDAVMRRTRARAVPDGRVSPGEALSLGLGLAALSVAMLALAAGWLAAGLLAFTIFFYAVIYTMWLKRVTPQNIVIGGAAGAFPPLIGWVVATGQIGVEAVLMFALIFMWTPPHFWALALFMKADYHEAKIPMLTVTHGRPETRRQIALYSLVLVPVAFGLVLTPIAGPAYLATACVFNAAFLWGALHIWRRDDVVAIADNYRVEKSFFRLSLVYMFAHFAALLADAALGLGGGFPWQ
ncbi:MAG: heme o synthase [Pseudomonadota bacterium]